MAELVGEAEFPERAVRLFRGVTRLVPQYPLSPIPPPEWRTISAAGVSFCEIRRAPGRTPGGKALGLPARLLRRFNLSGRHSGSHQPSSTFVEC